MSDNEEPWYRGWAWLLLIVFVVMVTSYVIVTRIDDAIATDRQRFEQAGHQAEQAGVPVEAVPYGHASPGREHWLKGWIRSRQERNAEKGKR